MDGDVSFSSYVFSGGDEGRKKNVDDLVRNREMTFTCLDAVKLTASWTCRVFLISILIRNGQRVQQQQQAAGSSSKARPHSTGVDLKHRKTSRAIDEKITNSTQVGGWEKKEKKKKKKKLEKCFPWCAHAEDEAYRTIRSITAQQTLSSPPAVCCAFYTEMINEKWRFLSNPPPHLLLPIHTQKSCPPLHSHMDWRVFLLFSVTCTEGRARGCV